MELVIFNDTFFFCSVFLVTLGNKQLQPQPQQLCWKLVINMTEKKESKKVAAQAPADLHCHHLQLQGVILSTVENRK